MSAQITSKFNIQSVNRWRLHEVKYDGYRMILIRDQDRVRLISRGGDDWAQHFR
jgi:ATP-dependent DNA ligase